MKPIVRRAIEADAATIAAVGRKSFSWTFSHLFTPDVLSRYLERTYSVEKIRSSLQKPNNLYFVAEGDRQVAAFLKLKRDCRHPLLAYKMQWQLQKLYVDPDMMGHGMGAGLMTVGEHVMTEQRADCTWLVVYKGNERALKFYQRFGYRDATVEFHDFEHIRVEFKVLTKEYQSPCKPVEGNGKEPHSARNV